MNRRQFMILGAACVPVMARAADAPVIHIVKDRNCGCCTEWARVLQDDGFRVTMENQIGTVLARHKIDSGIPLDMTSCHTAHIDGYAIEGHVPPADIRRLLALRPDAVGLAVPGMPYGSPGMGPWDQRDAFDVFLIARDGTAQVFTHYDAA